MALARLSRRAFAASVAVCTAGVMTAAPAGAHIGYSHGKHHSHLTVLLDQAGELPADAGRVDQQLVDRGALLNKTADIGAMELYASSVVSSDPFKLMNFLRPAFSA